MRKYIIKTRKPQGCGESKDDSNLGKDGENQNIIVGGPKMMHKSAIAIFVVLLVMLVVVFEFALIIVTMDWVLVLLRWIKEAMNGVFGSVC